MAIKDDPYCVGCYYYRAINSNAANGKSCDYLLIANHVRGCPAWDGCTRRLIKSHSNTFRQTSYRISKQRKKRGCAGGGKNGG